MISEQVGPFVWSFDLGLIVKKTFLYILYILRNQTADVSQQCLSTLWRAVDSLATNLHVSPYRLARVVLARRVFWHNLQIGGSSQSGRVWKGITPVLCGVGLGRTRRYCTWTGSSQPSICQSRTSHLKGWKCRGPEVRNFKHDTRSLLNMYWNASHWFWWFMDSPTLTMFTVVRICFIDVMCFFFFNNGPPETCILSFRIRVSLKIGYPWPLTLMAILGPFISTRMCIRTLAQHHQVHNLSPRAKPVFLKG